ncbi:lactonase family protein [uncultured Croceitalea sp.]|uniref:lactonase family protein n=1 Tax=uncultured Croceitalea sp. TaxID=1798908 RepID=UPI00330580CE
MSQLFVGTYTDGDSKGIYSYSFDPNTGTLLDQRLLADLPNPSFLAISTDKKNLYTVQETADFDSLGGGVTAFKLKEGLLEQQNSFGTQGAHPCHVALSEDGQLAASNYTGGNLAIFDLNADGSLQANPQVIDHKVLDTTKTPHVHKAHFNTDGLFVADLGLDAVKRYDKKGTTWATAHQSSLDMAEGAGPRHFTFSKDNSFLYVINELNSTITVLKHDEGSYNEVETQSTLATDFEGDSFCADIHLSADGKFLYGSNRGENTIVVFAVDAETGKLSLVGRTAVEGDWPRNFAMDPTGTFLFVANQRSNNITIFKRNMEKGTLTFLKEKTIGSPVCLVFLE